METFLVKDVLNPFPLPLVPKKGKKFKRQEIYLFLLYILEAQRWFIRLFLEYIFFLYWPPTLTIAGWFLSQRNSLLVTFQLMFFKKLTLWTPQLSVVLDKYIF